MSEWRYGAAKGADDVIYVTVSTGIGGGIVVDGRPLIGKDGTAGEIGHITVDIDGPICGDGQPGHAEAIGSGRAIAREGRALLARGEAPGLAALAARRGAWTPSWWPAPRTRATPPASASWIAPGWRSARCAPGS